jgi:aconitate hydratase
VRVVLAKSFARIHKANLINFGILPLVLTNASEYDRLSEGDILTFDLTALAPNASLTARAASGAAIALSHDLTESEIAIIKAGGLLNAVNDRQQ